MPALARGQTNDASYPELDIFVSSNGSLVDVYSLEFQIFDVSDAAKLAAPVQVYPATAGQRAAVAVGVTHPTAGAGRLSTGRYVAAPYTVPLDAALGTHRVRWFIKQSVSSPEATYQEDFEVLSEVSASGAHGYISIADVRAEGITTSMATDTRLALLIELASRLVETITRQWFDARTMTLTLDGDGSSILHLPIPIVSVSSVVEEGFPVDLTEVVVFNRSVPDDRRNPKLELRLGRRWACGPQTVEVAGTFGYLDRVGTDLVTPAGLRRACLLLVVREIEQLASSDRDGVRHGYRLLEEQTRDQRYKLAPWETATSGAFIGGTGDPEIDTLLRRYMKPIAVTSA